VKSALRVIAVIAASLSATSIAQVIKPGKWAMVTTPTSMDMPGMPPAMVARMKGRPITLTYCITPEQAQLGPRALAKAAPNCRYARFDVRGGQIDYQLICKQQTGTVTATATGNFTPTSFVTSGRTVTTGRRPMVMTSHTEGRRVGECGR
jgi:hypothetical protein